MVDFHQFLIFHAINIQPVYIRGGLEGHGGVVAKAKTKKQDDTNGRV